MSDEPGEDNDDVMPAWEIKLAERIARLRAEHAAARARLCSHGVAPELCADHRAGVVA